mgnify:CR=1 FL=1
MFDEYILVSELLFEKEDEVVDTLEEMTDTTTIDIVGSVELEGETVDGGNYIKDGDRVKIGGIISTVTKKFTKNNDIMARFLSGCK